MTVRQRLRGYMNKRNNGGKLTKKVEGYCCVLLMFCSYILTQVKIPTIHINIQMYILIQINKNKIMCLLTDRGTIQKYNTKKTITNPFNTSLLV